MFQQPLPDLLRARPLFLRAVKINKDRDKIQREKELHVTELLPMAGRTASLTWSERRTKTLG